MIYHSLHLQHFRSYADYQVQLAPGVNIIIGPNGSGKTNLLEAVYVLSAGTSFRGADRDLLQHGQDWLRAEAVDDAQVRVMTYRTNGLVAEKQFAFDGAKKARLTHQHRIPVVLFEPEHLRLLRGSPSHRREYLDGLLAKLHPDFSWLKHQFERVLLQRNNVLKRRLPLQAREDQLFAWDIKFAELAEKLVRRRQALVTEFSDRISEVYTNIAARASAAVVSYESTVPTVSYRDNLLRLLHERAGQDSERGFTSVGPQRDDFAVQLNGAPAATTASRGEVRTILLALKIIELHMFDAQYETAPILLLDDVFSELDSTRRRALAEMAKAHQTLITTTDADAILKHFSDDYRLIKTG